MAVPRRGATLGRGAVALALALVAVASVAGGATAGTPQPETDSTVTRIAVAGNGTATWEVQVRTRLTTEAEVEDYEAFQASFRENTSQYLDSFRRSMRGVVATAENETGREMRAVQFTASTSVQAAPRRWGIVSYRFRWTNFAVRDGDALAMGDVFGGEFLLTENDTLAVVAPDDYRVADVAPDATQRTDERVRWYGRRIFADGRPSVRFEPASSGTGTPDGDGPGGTLTDGSAAGGGDGGIGFPLAAIAVVGLVVVTLGAYRYVEHAGLPGRGPATTGGDDAGSAGGSDAATGVAPGSASEAVSGAAGAAGAAGAGSEADEASETDEAGEAASAPAAGDADPTDGSTGDIDPEPVITDAERVEELLAEHDGQLHQSDVIDALGWSKSKTSRVLSEMAEEGTIEKLRIGRRNVIRLDSADGPDESE